MNGPTWREALGLNPELEVAAPGHTAWSWAFWLVVLACASAYAYAAWKGV